MSKKHTKAAQLSIDIREVETIHPPEWLKFQKLTVSNVAKDGEATETSTSHFGKLFGSIY